MLNDMKVDLNAVLANAGLAADLFNRGKIILSADEYFRFWSGIERACEPRDFPLLLAEHMTVESFDAPIFAAICSSDLNTALRRLSHYKPLIGPMILDIKTNPKQTNLWVSCYGQSNNLPTTLGLTELVFFTELSRLATRERIEPINIELPQLPENIAAFEAYFGCRLKQGARVHMSFRHEDARKPFLTQNAAMWEFFEAKLNQKLVDMTANATTVERVRAVLLEALPSGQGAMEQVAGRLAMSKRTLQRKLTAEAETFQSVLQIVRAELADHYLEKSTMPLTEIAFLLGFNEANSFIRAYSSWKGMPPGSYRSRFN
ncbi:AraC family transcriptional regulator [Neiella marina]|uniref:AraC family transcriptional regulator n=2 Tax=Neiella marina TaxID=508461 RepID=A0A8J2U1S7_9GAMM|nr:AraC family transcriptional regulator [Neiella marina]